MEKARINAYIAKPLKDRLIDFCDDMGINMSAGIAVILKAYFDQQDVVKMMNVYEQEQKKQGLK